MVGVLIGLAVMVRVSSITVVHGSVLVTCTLTVTFVVEDSDTKVGLRVFAFMKVPLPVNISHTTEFES